MVQEILTIVMMIAIRFSLFKIVGNFESTILPAKYHRRIGKWFLPPPPMETISRPLPTWPVYITYIYMHTPLLIYDNDMTLPLHIQSFSAFGCYWLLAAGCSKPAQDYPYSQHTNPHFQNTPHPILSSNANYGRPIQWWGARE